jgi:hypothetical protein
LERFSEQENHDVSRTRSSGDGLKQAAGLNHLKMNTEKATSLSAGAISIEHQSFGQ